jgi:hypothetical protein
MVSWHRDGTALGRGFDESMMNGIFSPWVHESDWGID